MCLSRLPRRTCQWKSNRFRCLLVGLVGLVVLILLAIIIPLALIAPKSSLHKTLKSNVLVPLYIYPATNAWAPLYDGIMKHSGLDFTIVVNPNSGPGTGLYPNDDYISGIERLNTLSNARTLGYVHTSYARRDVQSVLKDVAIYSGWAQGNLNASTSGFAVQGIFVDEVPSVYSPEVAEYLKTINRAIKNSPGILGKKLVIHNPGQIPDARFSDNNTDTTVVFEDTYRSFQSKEAELAGLPQERSRISYLVHSLPTTMSKEDLRALLAVASQKAGYLFVTNLDQNYFESFGSVWSTFIKAMPTARASHFLVEEWCNLTKTPHRMDAALENRNLHDESIKSVAPLLTAGFAAIPYLQMLDAIIKHLRRRKDLSCSSPGLMHDPRMTPRSTVLFPLYIYPHPGAWEPLYEAITSHPDLKFLLVVNPHNGPGVFPLADSNYIREVARLNSIKNVCTVGYVKVDYGKRDLAEVYQDIEIFSQWSKDYVKTGLGVHGIFLDEAPNEHSDHIGSYLDNIGLKIKGMEGIMGDRIVIHNPGTTVDAKLAGADPGPDITAVVEESFAQYRSNSMQERLLLNSLNRSKCSYIVHTVPTGELRALVHQLRKCGEYLFVTDLCADYYSQFGPSWTEFIEAMVE